MHHKRWWYNHCHRAETRGPSTKPTQRHCGQVERRTPNNDVATLLKPACQRLSQYTACMSACMAMAGRLFQHRMKKQTPNEKQRFRVQGFSSKLETRNQQKSPTSDLRPLFLHLFPFNVRCWTFDVRCSFFSVPPGQKQLSVYAPDLRPPLSLREHLFLFQLDSARFLRQAFQALYLQPLPSLS